MGFFKKFWSILGIEQEEIREEEYFEEITEDEPSDQTSKNLSNIVSLHANKTMKILICEPEQFEEVQNFADHLKNRRQVVINLEYISPELSQRIIDFMSGTVYSLGGHTQQLGKHIFLFTPSNVEITQDHRTIMRKHGYSSNFGGENSE